MREGGVTARIAGRQMGGTHYPWLLFLVTISCAVLQGHGQISELQVALPVLHVCKNSGTVLKLQMVQFLSTVLLELMLDIQSEDST